MRNVKTLVTKSAKLPMKGARPLIFDERQLTSFDHHGYLHSDSRRSSRQHRG